LEIELNEQEFLILNDLLMDKESFSMLVVAIEEVSVIGALFPFVVVEVDGYPNSRMKNIASYLRKVEE
jgi:hypothetical protein